MEIAMEKPKFKITVDRHNQPLIIWNNPPGLFAEFNPEQMRKLVADLRLIAELAESKR